MSVTVLGETVTCSPRTWRWSEQRRRRRDAAPVLSTHVEVVRYARRTGDGIFRALHARGGGPGDEADKGLGFKCSPRTWRWSDYLATGADIDRVLSTHVEVVRSWSSTTWAPRCALHARGGGPHLPAIPPPPEPCSPRTWRWSVSVGSLAGGGRVLSTHVEVVRAAKPQRKRERGALHARGGGPILRCEDASTVECSPRTWRWSG